MKRQYIPLVAFILLITVPFAVIYISAYNMAWGIVSVCIMVGIVEWLISPKSKVKPPKLIIPVELEEKYNRFYINEILAVGKETKKKKTVQRIRRILLVATAVITLSGFMLAVMEDDKYLWIPFVGFLTFTGVLKSIDEAAKNITPNSNTAFINSILPTFIQKMVPGLDFNYSYRNFKQENSSEIKIIKEMLEAKEINFTDKFTLDYDLTVDYDLGWLNEYNEVEKIYNVCESRIERTSDRPVEARFNGLFGWGKINRFDEYIVKITPNEECNTVNSEDVVEKYLKIWSEDSVSLMSVSRDVLEYLAYLYKNTGMDFDIRIKSGKIFYIFPKGNDSKIYNLDKEEYKKYLFTYYYAVKTMQDINKILDK